MSRSPERGDARFNPLPPPKRRETPDRRGYHRRNGVSIHSPRRSGGRHAHEARVEQGLHLFQSTPPAEAEGDGRNDGTFRH